MPTLATQLIVFGGHIDFEKEPDTVLGAVARAGFSAVEAQLEDASRMRDHLAVHGMRHAAVHVTPSQLKNPQRWIDYLMITGARDVCNSGLLSWNDRTAADHDATAEILNSAGRALREAGIHLHYHNHDFELLEEPVTGMLSLEYLISRFDPEAVDLCVDVAWLHRAGLVPADFLRTHASRIGYLHIKDWDGKDWVPPGLGEVDLAGVVDVLPALDRVRWVTCEQDSTSGDPIECVRLSREWCGRHLPALA